MHISTLIYSFFHGKFVGKDQFNNKYYCYNISKKKQKRWVLYDGVCETSKIPPNWSRWLHYVTDNLPSSVNSMQEIPNWRKPHLFNLTGTKYSYNPNNTPKRATKTYLSWKPQI